MAKGDLFASWHTPEAHAVLETPVTVALRALDLVVIHAHICLALTHPHAVGISSRMAYPLLGLIEKTLESLGLPAPAGGWRKNVPAEPS